MVWMPLAIVVFHFMRPVDVESKTRVMVSLSRKNNLALLESLLIVSTVA